MNKYNLQHSEPAYHCGALMAVYAKLQSIAMPNVNAGIIQRYYASASRTPALVFAQLSRLANYHLDKLTSPIYFERQLSESYSALGDKIPTTLTLTEQSYFALGYYQKWAELNAKKEKAVEMEKKEEED